MTCREKLLIDYPENSEERMNDTCPDDYGYASEPIYCTTLFSSGRECIDCWDREVEEKRWMNVAKSVLITMIYISKK